METANSVLVDANVLMELLFGRFKAKECAESLNQYRWVYISPTTLHIIFYYARREGLDAELVEGLINKFTILNFYPGIHDLALVIYKESEMEDALQVTSAMYHCIDNFLTLDKNLAKKYKDFVKVELAG